MNSVLKILWLWLFLFFSAKVYSQADTANYILIDTLGCKSNSVDTVYLDSTKVNTKSKYHYLSGFLSVSQSVHKNWQNSSQNLNNTSVIGFFEFSKNKSYKNLKVKSFIECEYGYLHYSDSIFLKNIDRYTIGNELKQTIFKNLSIKAANRINSQFSSTYDIYTDEFGEVIQTLNSTFLSPAYNNASLGFNIDFWDDSFINFGIASGKITLVNNQKIYEEQAIDTLYGIAKNNKLRIEYGWGSQANFYKQIMKNILWECNWIYFANKDAPKLFDVEFNNKITLSVNKHIKTIITSRIIYDEDISDEIQVQQLFLIGYYF